MYSTPQDFFNATISSSFMNTVTNDFDTNRNRLQTEIVCQRHLNCPQETRAYVSGDCHNHHHNILCRKERTALSKFAYALCLLNAALTSPRPQSSEPDTANLLRWPLPCGTEISGSNHYNQICTQAHSYPTRHDLLIQCLRTG
jgi:hypothetical protein